MKSPAATTSPQAASYILLRAAGHRYYRIYGIYPQWAYVSAGLLRGIVGDPDIDLANRVAVVAGMVLVVNPKLEGVTVVMVSGRGEAGK